MTDALNPKDRTHNFHHFALTYGTQEASSLIFISLGIPFHQINSNILVPLLKTSMLLRSKFLKTTMIRKSSDLQNNYKLVKSGKILHNIRI